MKVKNGEIWETKREFPNYTYLHCKLMGFVTPQTSSLCQNPFKKLSSIALDWSAHIIFSCTYVCMHNTTYEGIDDSLFVVKKNVLCAPILYGEPSKHKKIDNLIIIFYILQKLMLFCIFIYSFFSLITGATGLGKRPTSTMFSRTCWR